MKPNTSSHVGAVSGRAAATNIISSSLCILKHISAQVGLEVRNNLSFAVNLYMCMHVEL